MKASKAEFERLGAEVIAVTFEKPERVKAIEPLVSGFTTLIGRRDGAYRAFGLNTARLGQLLNPSALWWYLSRVAKGRLWKSPFHEIRGRDTAQLGGDFVLDADGVLVFAYRSAKSTDRPEVRALLEAVKLSQQHCATGAKTLSNVDVPDEKRG